MHTISNNVIGWWNSWQRFSIAIVLATITAYAIWGLTVQSNLTPIKAFILVFILMMITPNIKPIRYEYFKWFDGSTLVKSHFFVFMLTATILLLLFVGDEIITSNNLLWSPCFTALCMQNAETNFLLLFKIAGASLATLAFYATVYRSSQTATQIEMSKSDIKFKNYIEHQKLFKQMIDEHFPEALEVGVYAPNIYGCIFPRNSYTYFSHQAPEHNAEQIHPFDEINMKYVDIPKKLEPSEDGEQISDRDFCVYMEGFIQSAFFELGLRSNKFILDWDVEKNYVANHESVEKTVSRNDELFEILEKLEKFSFFENRYNIYGARKIVSIRLNKALKNI